MIFRCSFSAVLIALGSLTASTQTAVAIELLPADAIQRLDVQRYWEMQLPLTGEDVVTRVALLDDNFYVLTNTNKVFAVHARTGVLRWSTIVADEGATIRGPSHSDTLALFTIPGGVRAFNRQTGEFPSEPRLLRGFIIDVVNDRATVTIGQVNGVRNGDVFHVFPPSAAGRFEEGLAVAKLKITAIETYRSKGLLTGYNKRRPPTSGFRIMANLDRPLEKIKLPFAAAGPAIADKARVYVGAANERFYCLNILTGFLHWQVLTPKTVSATPILDGEELIFAGQDGRVICCTKRKAPGKRIPKTKWIFETKGTVFADIVVTPQRVFAASTDRSLYCLNRAAKKGQPRKLWQKRFDNPLSDAPILSNGRVYQTVPLFGLVALDEKTGDRLWVRPDGGRFLVEFESDVYLLGGEGPYSLVRVEGKTGTEKAVVNAGLATFAEASQQDQSILLGTLAGRLACYRSRKAPPLKAAQLAEVLRNDSRMRFRAELDAKEKTEREKEKPAGAIVTAKPRLSKFMENLLRSTKTGRPVGGTGLVEVPEEEDESVYDRQTDIDDEDALDDEDEDEFDDEDEADDEDDEEEEDDDDEEDDEENEDDEEDDDDEDDDD